MCGLHRFVWMNIGFLFNIRQRSPTLSEKPTIQPRGLGTGRSVDLQPDTHACPGKLWVRCGGGDNTRGGLSEGTCRPFISVRMRSGSGMQNPLANLIVIFS